MKTMKRLAALMLTLCILVGMPMSVSAVGTAAPTEMKLVGAMPITSDIRVGSALHTNASWGDKGLTVFFNQPVPENLGSTRCYIVVVDGDNQVVRYNGTDLVWSTNRSTAELWQIRGNFLAFNMTITIGGKAVGTWTSLAEALTTDAALAGQGYRIQLRMMGVSGEVTNNGYVDTVVNNGQKLASNLKVVSNSSPVNGGSTDCYYVEIGTAVAASSGRAAYVAPSHIVTLNKVAMVNETQMSLTFSETVTIDTARNDAVLEIVSADGNTVAQSYPVTLTNGHTATLSTVTWTQIQADLASAAAGSYVRFKMTEKNINTDYGENQFNFVVDTVWGTDSLRPLRSNTGAAAQYAYDFVLCNVQAPGATDTVTLTDASPLSVQGKEYVVLTFSEPVSWLSGGTAPYLSLNVINQSGVVISVGGSIATRTLAIKGYYGADGTKVITELSGTSNYGGKATIAEIRELIGELGTNRLVVRVIDKSGVGANNDVDSIYSTAEPEKKLISNMLSGAEEWAVVDLAETAVDSVSVEAVRVYKERNLILTFDRPVVATANLYSAIRLVDENNTLYWADANTGGATVYRAGSGSGATKPLQWIVSGQTVNNTQASVYAAYGTTGNQLIGTLAIDYSTLEQIEKDAETWFADQGTPKDLSLRLCLEEKTVSADYGYITSANGVVDSVYAADGSCLPVSKGNANGHYVDLADANAIVIESAEVTGEQEITVTFSEPVRNDIYSQTKFGEVMAGFVDPTTGAYYTESSGYRYRLLGTWTPDTASGTADEGYTRWFYNDIHTEYGGNKAANMYDMLAAVKASMGQLYGYEVRLIITQQIENGDIADRVDNFTSADGTRLLKATHGSACQVAVTAAAPSEPVSIIGYQVIGEQQMKITFSEEVKLTSAVFAGVRLTDADGYMVGLKDGQDVLTGASSWQQWSGNLTPVEGESDDEWILTLTWSGAKDSAGNSVTYSFTRMGETWEKEWKDKGYKLNFALESDVIAANGLIEEIESAATGRKLVATGKVVSVSGIKSGWNDFVHLDITGDAFFAGEPLTMTEVKQHGTNQLLVSFNREIKLNDVEKGLPYIGLRLVDNVNYGVRRANKTGFVGTSDSGVWVQWKSTAFKVLDTDATKLLVTFDASIDVADLVNMENFPDWMKDGNTVMFCIEETDPKTGLFSTADKLVHNIITPQGAQLQGNKKASGANGTLMAVTLVDPDAPVTVTSTKITGQTEITFTFSEPVDLSSNMTALLRYVDADSYALFKTDEDGYVQWKGNLAYTDETKMTVKWTLAPNNPANKNLRQINLADIFDLVKAKDSLKSLNGTFALCIEEGKNPTIGFVDTYKALSGKVIEAQPYIPTNYDGIYIDIDTSQAIRGQLSLVSAKAVADNELLVTFSAPIAIEHEPFFCIRLFNKNDTLLWRTAEGEYVTSSKDAEGNSNTPVQWPFKWEYADEAHTQIRFTLQGMQKLDWRNLTEILTQDWNEVSEGAYVRFFIEEKDEPMILNNCHVDNIALASDSRIRLAGNKFSGRDGVGLDVELGYTPVTITPKVEVLNETQLRVSFSHKIDIAGDPYMAICYVDDEYTLLTHLDLGNHYPQWSGSWKWENDSHTSIIWTMGSGAYGCKTIAEVMNKSGYLADLYPDANIMFRIEDKNSEQSPTAAWTDLVENISTAGGTVHLTCNVPKGNGGDRHFATISGADKLAGDPISLTSVKAIDNLTLELTFSEAIAVKEGDAAPVMAIRYLSSEGNTEVGIDGRTLSFTGTWSYKDDNKNVIIWKLNTEQAAKRGASSLDDIFTYAGDFQWNKGARISFVIIDPEEEAVVSSAMRISGITSLNGYRLLTANKTGDISQVQTDIEISYTLPVITEPVEEVVEYVTEYTPAVIGAAGMVVAGVVVSVVLAAVRKKKED